MEDYLNDLKAKGISFDDKFVESEYERIASIMSLVNLPDRVITGPYIDIAHLPKNTRNLYNEFEDCCFSIDSAIVCLEKYEICPYIVSMLVEKLYKRCLIEDVSIPLILYIDTPHFVSELGNIIAKDKSVDGRSSQMEYSLDTIYEYIYSARYVFWNRFSLDFGPYYNGYISDILKSRYNKCLGNMYFTDKQYNNFIEGIDVDTNSILNIKAGIHNLLAEQKKIKLIGGSIDC